MQNLLITVTHPSISQAAMTPYSGTMHGAMVFAKREFGDGYNGHAIVIMDAVTRNRLALWIIGTSRKWTRR